MTEKITGTGTKKVFLHTGEAYPVYNLRDKEQYPGQEPLEIDEETLARWSATARLWWEMQREIEAVASQSDPHLRRYY
jgi:hypothetical protein